MPYKISSTDNNKIVLERLGTGCAMSIFILVGSIFLIVGIAFNYFSSSFEFPFILFRTLPIIMGLGAIVTGIYMPSMTSKSTPESITFDNNKGSVIIEMSKETGQTGYIRYDEISGFDIYTERRSSSSSSRGSSSSSTYYYHVFLKKKDGGEWYLTESGSHAKAEEIQQQLESLVQLTRQYSLNVSPVLTDKLIKEETYSKTEIQWKNKVSIGMPIFLFVFASIFIGIAVGIVSNFDHMGFAGFFPVIVVSFIGIVFCIVMTGVIKKMIRDFTSNFSVIIDKQNFEYRESSKSTGEIKKSKIIPLKDVYMISYTYSPVKTYGNAGLTVLTREDHDQVLKNIEKPLEAVKDLFSGKDGPIKLDINSLNPVECLQLETWLQELIKKKGDVTVL